MEITKDLLDFATTHTPLGRWLARFSAAEERKRILASFADDFAKHPEDESSLLDYFHWNDEASLWAVGDGDVYGTSYAEFIAIWTNPAIYRYYEATLLRYVRSGGCVHRTIVVGEEYFSPELQLILLRTGMRQTILGIEPAVAHRLDVAPAIRDLGVHCDMLGVANNRIGYFIRLSPAPCMVRTTNKRFIGRAWETYRALSHDGHPFQEWLRQRSFADRLDPMLPQIEEEARLISEYANDAKTRNG